MLSSCTDAIDVCVQKCCGFKSHLNSWVFGIIFCGEKDVVFSFFLIYVRRSKCFHIHVHC